LQIGASSASTTPKRAPQKKHAQSLFHKFLIFLYKAVSRFHQNQGQIIKAWLPCQQKKQEKYGILENRSQRSEMQIFVSLFPSCSIGVISESGSTDSLLKIA
jgi:hypothetical protein